MVFSLLRSPHCVVHVILLVGDDPTNVSVCDVCSMRPFELSQTRSN